MRYYIIIIASVVASCCAASAAEPEAFTLEKCIATGLERNYSIRIIKNESEIATNNATPGNAGMLPTVDISGGFSGSAYDYNYNYADGSTGKEKGVNSETANVGANLNWTLFDGFGIQADYKRLKELQSLGELSVRMAIEDLTAAIAAEYYNLIRQRIRLKNLTSAVNLSRERLRIVEEKYIIGALAMLDVSQAKVDFNADSSLLTKQYEEVYSSQIKLNELMGLDLNEVSRPLAVGDSIDLHARLLDEADLWQKTLVNNSQLLTAIGNKTVSELDLKKLRSRNYPYVRLNAGYGYAANWYATGNTDLQRRLGLNYGVTVGLPIFDGFNRRREQRNAAIQVRNRELRVQEVELSLKADMSNLWMAYENNLSLWKLEKENLTTAREYYETAIERFKLGVLAGIELREAQNSLLEAEERRSIAEYNTKLCEISLLQLSGQVLSYLN